MSKYTSELRYICEAKSGFTPEQLQEKTIDEIVVAAAPNIFNFNFPIYDEAFRPVLEHEILFHFYLDEIGAETYGRWQYFLARKLREIMPYYNKLYESAELEFNPFYDTDYTKTHGGRNTGNKQTTGNVQQSSESDGTTTDTSETTQSGSGAMTGTSGSSREKHTNDHEVTNTTSENDGTGTRAATGSKTVSNTYSESSVSRDAYSDTPQTSVLGVEGDGSGSPTNNVSDNYYLTNYRKIAATKSGSNSGSESTTDNETTTTHNEGAGNSTTDKTGSEAETINGTTGENTVTSGHAETSGNGTTHDETSATTASTGSEAFINTDDYTERVSGKMGTQSYSSMLQEYRETFLNINKMIFDELECCFMEIY